MTAPNETITCETTIRSVIAGAKAGRILNHAKTDSMESWTIGSDVGDYRVEVINRMSKSERTFNKTNFYSVAADGTERKVNLGEWKKKLFYTLLYCLQNDKIFTKNVQDPDKIKSIMTAMKNNPSEWVMSNDSITGTMGDVNVQVIRDRKTFDSGKVLYRVKLLENGVETLKGSQLMKLWKQYALVVYCSRGSPYIWIRPSIDWRLIGYILAI